MACDGRVGATLAGAAASLVLCAGSAATWSIILVDTRTGEVAAGSATCLTGFDLRAFTPVMLTGVGAATAQSFVDSSQQNRTLIRDRMRAGVPPADILAELAVFDSGHQTRQYGMADVLGRTATFSGTGAGAWAGGQTGQFEYTYLGQTGTIVYAIQGNVLTGEPVVLAAVQAAQNTHGDVAQRLMAAMEAARSMGGDGRCSCTPSDPTGCGAPPASFAKSAHIAYMLIARDGDRDASHGAYRVGTAASGVDAAELTGDGRIDLVTVNLNSTNASVLRNTTPAGGRFASFGPATHTPTLLQPRALLLADIGGDGLADLLVANAGSSIVSVQRGLGNGGWGTRMDAAVGASPQALAVGELDGLPGLDAATANATGDSVTVLLSNGAGGLAPSATLAVGDDPRSIAIADVDRDGDGDLVVAVRAESRLATLLNNGAGEFSPGESIATAQLPTFVVAADVDRDGDDDLAAAHQGTPGQVSVHLNTGGGFAPAVVPLPSTPAELRAGDVTGDGRPDLVVPLLSGSQFLVLTGTPLGEFSVAGAYSMGAAGFIVTPRRPALADLDGDHDLDVAFNTGQPGGVFVVENRGDGVFNSGCGTGFGDYFLTLNIAMQMASDPDPVFQLQEQFGEWRQAHEGRPDAVQSEVSVPTGLVADGVSSGVARITLRDWRGEPAAALSCTVTLDPTGAGAVSIGPVTPLGSGEFEAVLTSTGIPGEDRLIITAEDGVRPVVLMPRPMVLVVPCRADFDHDGFVTGADFDAFVLAFEAGGQDADFDADGFVSGADFDAFVLAFEGGC